MIMTMIAHVTLANGIAITGMHDFVAHSVGGKMAEKNHHGVMIVTLGIFKRRKLERQRTGKTVCQRSKRMEKST